MSFMEDWDISDTKVAFLFIKFMLKSPQEAQNHTMYSRFFQTLRIFVIPELPMSLPMTLSPPNQEPKSWHWDTQAASGQLSR